MYNLKASESILYKVNLSFITNKIHEAIMKNTKYRNSTTKGEGKASIVLQPSRAAARGRRLVAPLRQVAVRPFDELESRHRDMLLLLGWPRSRWLLQVGAVNLRYDHQVPWLDLSSRQLVPGLALSTSSRDRLDHLRQELQQAPQSASGGLLPRWFRVLLGVRSRLLP